MRINPLETRQRASVVELRKLHFNDRDAADAHYWANALAVRWLRQ